MLLLGEHLSATDAERFGLVNKLLDSEQLNDTVDGVAARLSAKPADALRTSRALLNARKQGMLEVIEREGEQFGRLMQTPEFKENLEKFLQKSKAG